MQKTILITGGAGFIGSHTSLVLVNNGYKIILLDNFDNSNYESINRIKRICDSINDSYSRNIIFIYGDVKDEILLNKIFDDSKSKGEKIHGVIHLAGFKSVSESVSNPLKYWDQNLIGTISLLKVMNKFGCRNLVFSSSATIYGLRYDNFLKESFVSAPINTYGETKNSIEKMLRNLFDSGEDDWKIICLRYFNPIGAHASGILGEYTTNKSENLFPIICEVASNKRKVLYIYGNNWPTLDGTCIRDYVHVMDIAEAHFKAIEYLLISTKTFHSINLGTGAPTSVLELVRVFEKVNNIKINYSFSDKREGDVPILCADITLAKEILDWSACRDLDQMCIDGWKSYLNNFN